MFYSRRRRIAWMFALALILELALLCCACGHLIDHRCEGPHTCPLCRFLRGGFRPALTPQSSVVAPSVSRPGASGLPGLRFVPATPIARRVRLND